MAAYRRVYDSRHLQADCQEPELVPETYARQSGMGNPFYRAMLCIRGSSHGPVSVCLSVRPSQVGVLLKRQNG